MPMNSSQLQVGVPRKSAMKKVIKVSMNAPLCSKVPIIRIRARWRNQPESELRFEKTEVSSIMLNYRHLYYFWMVAKEGDFSRAAERLDMAIQTISAQVRELEKNLGHQLLKPAGRGVALTDA